MTWLKETTYLWWVLFCLSGACIVTVYKRRSQLPSYRRWVVVPLAILAAAAMAISLVLIVNGWR